jgi:hypothetical protein
MCAISEGMRVAILLPCALLAACAPAPAPCTPCQPPSSQAPTPVAQTASAAPRPPQLDELGERRVDLSRKRVAVLALMYDKGAVGLTDLLAAYRDVAFAARDSGLRGDVLRKALQDYRDAMVALREHTHVLYKAGAVNDADVDHVDAAVAEAEYWLAEAGQ